jgi:hypothetical protein
VIHTLHSIARSKSMKSLATVLLVCVMGCGVAGAQERRTGAPSRSAPGAEVYFIDLKDGATVPAKLNFGLRNMNIAPAGTGSEDSGHHHLLIDTDLPPLDQPIPNDFNHLHFGGGQTEAEIALKPGEHTLQLLIGDKDHIPHTPPVMSRRIRVRVEGKPEAAALTGGPSASPPGAEVYFIDPVSLLKPKGSSPAGRSIEYYRCDPPCMPSIEES